MTKLIRGLAAVAFAGAQAAWAADATLVQHDGVVVTVADFDAYMERVPAANRIEARASDERNNKVVDILFTNRMLARDARSAGLDKDPAIARRLAQQAEAFLAQQYIAHLERNVAIPKDLEARARELYLASPKRFTEPDRVDLEHILISFHRRTPEMAREFAAKVRAKALAGEDFLALAKEHSEDPGFKRDGGRLGPVSATDIEESLAKAAFALKANGDLTEPVETRSGYHILKRVGFTATYKRPFDEVKAALVEAEMARLRSESSLKLVDSYRRNPQTKWNPAGIAALRTEIPREEIAARQKEELERLQREAEQRARQGGAPSSTAPATR